MKPLVEGVFILKKYPGKGGWTYAEVPVVAPEKKNPFGWMKVKGSIDAFELKQYKLMPMGNGKLFLPVKAEIRKKIKKEEGDQVHVVLFADDSPVRLTPELAACLQLVNPKLIEVFAEMKEGQQKFHLDRIHAAKTEHTKDQRINRFIDVLSNLLYSE